jgi:hypothetical protein
MLKVPNDTDNIVERSLILNGKRLSKLSRDVLYAGFAITSLPNVCSRKVQLMDEVVMPIKHYCFFLNYLTINVCPTFWVIHN